MMTPTPKPQTPEDELDRLLTMLVGAATLNTQGNLASVRRIERYITAIKSLVCNRERHLAASEEVDRYTTWLTDNDPTNYLEYSHSRHKELDEQRNSHKEVI